MAAHRGTTLMQPERLTPGCVAALARKPEYCDVFPIGSGLVEWAVWAA